MTATLEPGWDWVRRGRAAKDRQPLKWDGDWWFAPSGYGDGLTHVDKPAIIGPRIEPPADSGEG